MVVVDCSGDDNARLRTEGPMPLNTGLSEAWSSKKLRLNPSKPLTALKQVSFVTCFVVKISEI
jgi:hypothetical protein